MKWTDQSPANEMPSASQMPATLISKASRTLSSGEPLSHCRALIGANVHQQVLQHLRRESVEQGGLLIGVPYADAGDSPSRIVIIDAIEASQSVGTGFSLRMEAAVWSAANERLRNWRQSRLVDANHCRIIGWYHSHPGLGAFFSSTDMSTQAAFFRHDYSVGWVIDPSDDTHAAFLGPDSMPIHAQLTELPTT